MGLSFCRRLRFSAWVEADVTTGSDSGATAGFDAGVADVTSEEPLITGSGGRVTISAGVEGSGGLLVTGLAGSGFDNAGGWDATAWVLTGCDFTMTGATACVVTCVGFVTTGAATVGSV
jgi:hypothetical protein